MPNVHFGFHVLALVSIIISSFSSFSNVSGCHELHKRSQPSAAPPPQAPTRELEWGDLNILHTTDSHGWLLGHLKSESPEPNYSGDFGDFQSFVEKMKKKARERNVDLLVVDSGDLHDGNGLSDAEPFVNPGVPRGFSSSKLFARVPYDVLAIGNHELYDLPIAQNMHDNFAPSWKGSYLTSNVNITTSGISVPLGSRYRKFITEQGRKVTAFGIIFHFTGNANGTIVQPPAQLVLEPWFKEVIQDKPDLFLLAGHMGIRDPDWKVVLDAIRAVHPNVPVVILGGHYHIRDCRQLDDRSMSLASGRYMETVGWMSLTGLGKRATTPKFSRRYLDANRLTYEFHAGLKFDTAEGAKTTRSLTEMADRFQIYQRFGVAPHSFYGYRVPSNASNSLSYLFTGPDGVLQTVVKNPRRSNPILGIIHTTAMRADLYAGNFTANDQFITMPFNNSFQYIPDVPRAIANEVMEILNSGGPVRLNRESNRVKRHLNILEMMIRDEKYHSGHDVADHYLAWMQLQSAHHHQLPLSVGSMNQQKNEGQEHSYGYVTKDECPGYGDDVVHTPLTAVDQTEYVATTIPKDASLIDVVFDSFTAKFIIEALNKVISSPLSSKVAQRNYTLGDVREYSPVRANEVLGIYAQRKWN